MAEQSNDRLFEGEGICCLCGKAAPFVRKGGPHSGARYCGSIHTCIGALELDAVDAEISRRLALTPPAPPAESEFFGTQPPAGELPDVLPDRTICGILGERYHLNGLRLSSTGAVYSFQSSKRVRDGLVVHAHCEHRKWACHVRDIDWTTVRRPASTPPVRETTQEPSATVRGIIDPPICGDCGKPITNAREACVRTRVNRAGFREYIPGAFHAQCPTTAAPNQPKPDPYTNFPYGMNEKQIEAAMVIRDAEYLAAHRMRSSRAEIEGGRAKGAESAHPVSWPADAGESYELAATEGWTGR